VSRCATRATSDPNTFSVRGLTVPYRCAPSSNEASPWSATNKQYPDPESYDWDPLDGELAKKLDTRPYVSLSRDRAPQDAKPIPDISPDVDETELSLFDINMPGVLTLDEVKALDLDHWYLLYHGSFVQMDVSVILLSARTMFLFLTWHRILLDGTECPWTARSR